MRRYRAVIFSSLLLAAIAFIAHRWTDLLQRSVRAYNPPLANISIMPGERLPGLTTQVVMVVVSGVSYRETVVQDMPAWQGLANIGATAPVQIRPPAYWPSVWTTLLSGAGNELNRAPLLLPEVGSTFELRIDNVLMAARDADLRIAAAVSADRAPLFASVDLDAVYFAQGNAGELDAQIVKAALGFIAEREYHLIIVHLGLPEAIGGQYGTSGPAYRAALRQVDSYVRQIVRQMNLGESVLLLTSDGALLSDGRPAGGHNNLPTLPLVAVGQGIITGEYSPVQLADIAPTLAALLGIRLPVMAEGYPLFDMMQLEDEMLARSWLLSATQKVTWAQAYLEALQQSPSQELLQQDLHTATSSFWRGNYSGTIAAAQLVSKEAAAVTAMARNARIKAERWPRAFLLAIGIIAPLMFFWIRRPARPGVILIAALVAVAVLYALYGLNGQDFSLALLSNITNYLGAPLVRDVLIGLMVGGLIVLFGLLSVPPSRWQVVLTITCDYTLSVCYMVALPALTAYWQHGAWITWYLPDPFMLALQTLALHHLVVLGIASLPLPWLLGLVVWFRERRRAQASSRMREWDPIAYLRR
ncbi:MAG: hypothetical protein ACUVSF_01340 [Anaerolineae bacterium]